MASIPPNKVRLWVVSTTVFSVLAGLWVRQNFFEGNFLTAKVIFYMSIAALLSSLLLVFLEELFYKTVRVGVIALAVLAASATLSSHGLASALNFFGLGIPISRIAIGISVVSSIISLLTLYQIERRNWTQDVGRFFQAAKGRVQSILQTLLQSKRLNTMLQVVVCLVPAIVAAYLVYGVLNASLFEIVPRSPNDEIAYFKQIEAFARASFSSGYFVVNELTASAKFSPFGPHGPGLPILYGSLAKLTGGWQMYSATFFGLSLLAGALFFFGRVSRLRNSQLFLLALTLATFWYGALHWASNMQEALHQVIAIMLVTAMYFLISRREPVTWLQAFLLSLLLFAASLLRFTWSFYFPVVLLLPIERITPKKLVLSLGFGGLFALSSFFVFVNLAAPYPSAANAAIVNSVLTGQLVTVVEQLVAQISFNLERLSSVPSFVAAVSFASLAILLSSLIYLAKNLRLVAANALQMQRQTILVSLFCFLSSGVFLLATLFAYDVSLEGTRALAIGLFASLLILIAFNHWRLPLAVAFSMLFVSSSFLNTYLHEFGLPRFYTGSNAIQQFAEEMRPYVRFQPQQNRWCNTVLVSSRVYSPEIIGFEAGIGLSVLNMPPTEQFNGPPRSKYVLISTEDPRLNQTGLVELTTTARATLYYNQDSGCPYP